MSRPYIVFGQPLIEEPEIQEVVASLKSAWLGTGPKVAEFEARIAAYKGVKHAIAVNSCTAGLHLSCVVLGISPGDEVILPAMTFCATVNAVIHAGGTPVPVDVEFSVGLPPPSSLVPSPGSKASSLASSRSFVSSLDFTLATMACSFSDFF